MFRLSTAILIGMAYSGFTVAQGRPSSICHGYLAMEVRFSPRSSMVDPAESERLIAFGARVREADYCPLSAVIAVGHADASEGPSNFVGSLAAQRAAAVLGVIEQSGVPNAVFHVEAKGSSQPLSSDASRNARVEVEVHGGCPTKECSRFPRGVDGFRLSLPNVGTDAAAAHDH